MTTHTDNIEVPYGWRMVDGRIVSDATEQAIIARVCALRASGLSVGAIAAGLAMEATEPGEGSRKAKQMKLSL